jgi:hypothetical protein
MFTTLMPRTKWMQSKPSNPMSLSFVEMYLAFLFLEYNTVRLSHVRVSARKFVGRSDPNPPHYQ